MGLSLSQSPTEATYRGFSLWSLIACVVQILLDFPQRARIVHQTSCSRLGFMWNLLFPTNFTKNDPFSSPNNVNGNRLYCSPVQEGLDLAGYVPGGLPIHHLMRMAPPRPRRPVSPISPHSPVLTRRYSRHLGESSPTHCFCFSCAPFEAQHASEHMQEQIQQTAQHVQVVSAFMCRT